MSDSSTTAAAESVTASISFSLDLSYLVLLHPKDRVRCLGHEQPRADLIEHIHCPPIGQGTEQGPVWRIIQRAWILSLHLRPQNDPDCIEVLLNLLLLGHCQRSSRRRCRRRNSKDVYGSQARIGFVLVY